MRSDDTVAQVMSVLGSNGYIAGGYVRWMMSESAIDFGDVDVWSPSIGAFHEMRSRMKLVYRQPGHEQPYSWDYYFENVTISLIKPIDIPGRVMFGSPNQVISKFDLSFLRGWSLDGRNFPHWENKNDLQDAYDDRVRLVNISSWQGNMRRLIKYVRKGFDVPLEEFEKLAQHYAEHGAGLDTGDSTRGSDAVWG